MMAKFADLDGEHKWAIVSLYYYAQSLQEVVSEKSGLTKEVLFDRFRKSYITHRPSIEEVDEILSSMDKSIEDEVSD